MVFCIFLCDKGSAVKAQPRTLRVLKCYAFWLTLSACLLFYRFALFFCISLLLRFSLVGYAHTRTLFAKSVAKTFIVSALYLFHLSPVFFQNFPLNGNFLLFFCKKIKERPFSRSLKICFHIIVFNILIKDVENIIFIRSPRSLKKSREPPCFFCEE